MPVLPSCLWSRRPSPALLLAGLLVSGVAGFSAVAADRPLVSPVFGDHMVLQRGKPNPVWGWTVPGAEVRVRFAGQEARTEAAADGRWSLTLAPPPTGGPYTLEIDGPGQDLVLHDVLVGDVWLCGGQSNMEMGIGTTSDAQADLAAADRPKLRLFMVQNQVAYAPAAVVKGSWRTCTPANLAAGGWGGFSAVGYHFGRRLQEELHVPIGLIQSCVGGTPAEAWAGASALRALHDFDPALDEVERLRARGGPQYGNFIAHWYDEFDLGQRAGAEPWSSPAFDDRDWAVVNLADAFARLEVPETPAVVYFRRTVELPDPLPAGAARLSLGVVERMDTAWINGRWVGASAWVENPRVYPVPDGLLRPGANTLIVRVLKTRPDGGFRSPPDQLRLVLGDQSAVPLAEGWRARVSVDARPPHPLPAGYENWPTMPGVLYNGMIAPLAPLALTGAIWYQGEANVGRAAQYRILLPAMIADWRRAFGQGNFPFYLVSLAAFTARRDQPGDDAWAELREAQALVARTVAHSGLALAIDKGEAGDIHPRDKRPIGERLALQALAGHYGRGLVASGPVFRSAEPVENGSALRLRFDHAEGGLVVQGDKPAEFSLAGEDLRWAWAEARVENDTVVASSPAVPRPRFVRYAWQGNPQATLFNAAGLPAVPFRTDGPLAADAEGAPPGNPLFRDSFTADPAPLVVGDTLYVYVGQDEAKDGEMFTMTGWRCYSTKDMKTWTSHGVILRPTDFKWAVRDAWAAQVVERNGRFYFYGTVQHDDTSPGKAIGVAVADHPLGPFVDARGSALVTDATTPSDKPWNDIDPTVMIDDDGSAYLAWGNPYLYLAKLKPNMTELDGEIRRIDLPNYTEGPWLHKRGDTYYLTYAAFAHQGTAEKICYATAPSIHGPWTYRGILTGFAENSYTIHPGIVEFQGRWYFFYHNATLTLNGLKGALGRRAVCAEYLGYKPDGTLEPVVQTAGGLRLPPR